MVPAEDVLEVRVRDLSETGVHARGKQRLDRGEIWYTAQSGIWQTVWLEPVPAAYVERLVLVPHLEERRARGHRACVVSTTSAERCSLDHRRSSRSAASPSATAVAEACRR